MSIRLSGHWLLDGNLWTHYKTLLKDLINDGRIELLAVVRQEVLSGLRHQEQFERLRFALRAFANMALDVQDYELAAHYFDLYRAKGVQGANTDFLICAEPYLRNPDDGQRL